MRPTTRMVMETGIAMDTIKNKAASRTKRIMCYDKGNEELRDG